jgi:hypothetical protein
MRRGRRGNENRGRAGMRRGRRGNEKRGRSGMRRGRRGNEKRGRSGMRRGRRGNEKRGRSGMRRGRRESKQEACGNEKPSMSLLHHFACSHPPFMSAPSPFLCHPRKHGEPVL